MSVPAFWGEEFIVNTTMPGAQWAPSIAALPNGRFVAVWQDNNEVTARVYHADGSPMTGEIAVTATVPGLPIAPVVTALNDGRFVVAWADATGAEIGGRIYNPSGSPATSAFTIAESSNGLDAPSLAALPTGGFVATWQEYSGGTNANVLARTFDEENEPGSVFIVDSGPAQERRPVVAALSNDRYVIVWEDEGSAGETDGSGSHIRARICPIDPSQGSGEEFIVNSTAAGNQTDPAVAVLPDGRFVVSWTQDGNAGIRARVFDSDGGALDNEFSVSSDGSQSTVTGLHDSRYIISYVGDSFWNSGIELYGTMWEGNSGDIVGEVERFILDSSSPNPDRPVLATLADGRVIALWSDAPAGEVRAQIIEPRLSGVVVDGTDLGDEFIGSDEDDVLTGGVGHDWLEGKGGDDVLEGGLDGDDLYGGDGDDTASYKSSGAGVTVNLTTGTGSGGDAADDVLSSIEIVVGSLHPDVLVGDDEHNTLSGGAGNDVLKGAGGYDRLAGEAGNDTVVGGALTDMASFSGARADYAMNLLANGNVEVVDLRPGSPEGTDTLIGVEMLQFTDRLVAPVAALSDVVWQHSDSCVATAEELLFGLMGDQVVVAGVGDFDADGDADMLWRHPTGHILAETIENGHPDNLELLSTVSSSWQVRGVADFDADGDDDILWRHNAGQTVIWEMQDGDLVTNHNLPSPPAPWQIAGTGDFDGDGDADILWRHNNGAVVTWEVEDGNYVEHHSLHAVGTRWQVAGIGDFDADGDDDILWIGSGLVTTWEMQDGGYVTNHNQPNVSSNYRVAGTHDFDDDGDADILWHHSQGQLVTWDMQDGNFVQSHNYGVVSTEWQIRGTGEFGLA